MTNNSELTDFDAIIKSIGRNFDKVHGKTKPSKDAIEKAIRRNAVKLGKQANRAGYALLTEMGFGKTPFCYSKDTSVEGIIHAADKENYPKQVSAWKPTPPPALSLDN